MAAEGSNGARVSVEGITPGDILKKYWGYDHFRPCQHEIIQSVLSGNDTLGLLPTGGGKSVTFQVPAMMLPGLTVVVTPLVSLMKDQVDNLKERGIRAVYMYSGLTRREVRLAYDRCRLGKTKMLYVSPERLRSDSFMEELQRCTVSLIVVDEAHCISQWGYDFRPSYLRIARLREICGMEVPVLALTASATPDVREDIMRNLKFRPGFQVHSRSFDRDNLSYVVRYSDSKIDKLLQVLNNTSGSAIVYVRSRVKTKQIADALRQNDISADYYHAALDQRDKAQKQEQWKCGRIRVMVATNAFGMGIDKADVRLVAHMDLPPSLEEYYQEAGRAGRDGRPAFAVVIASKADKVVLTKRLNETFPPVDYIRRVYELAGNFVNLPVGEGFEKVFEFDFNRFCDIYDLQARPARGALALLTQAGYVEYVDEAPTRSRLMFLCRREELYSIPLSHNADAVVMSILRIYTGVFTEYVYVDEVRIAKLAELKEADVYPAMLELGRAQVLHYIPHKAIPYLYYTTSRELPKYITLPRSVYDDRRELMKHRLDAVRHFVFDGETCRSRTLLEYFGEKDVPDCGRCDVCRARRKKIPPVRTDEEVDSVILEALEHGPVPMEQLPKLMHVSQEHIIRRVRALMEVGRITVSGENFIKS